ncbi:MAG TPA: VOC family protein [Caulobacteraceae bacterium]|jgi:catechol 2,3-dioxygenase-like lactoylglutathione lyase family enzyme|nr:VOC family protein [Caulobacteraceae bacterium]
MSNIENLKKQAKQILRWHREWRWTVATDIRNALPEFEGLTDREVFERPFKLTDAQAMLAKRHGYASWQALSAALAEKPAPQPAPPAAPESRVSYALPFVYVRDLAAALAFYGERLGFQTEFAYGQPPFYAQVIRDGVRLALKHSDDGLIEAMQPFRSQGDGFITASIALDRAQPLYLEYEAAGVRFRQPLRRESWGAWSFIVEDPDGNLLVFAGMGEHKLEA